MKKSLAAIFYYSCASLTSATLMGQTFSGGKDWPSYLGGPERNHYSPLSQINTSNVATLQKAWEFKTGDPGQMQCNSIVVGETLYGVTASNQIFALNAATGKELWRYVEAGSSGNRTLRGVTFWQDGDDQRILFSLDAFLCAVDARTGKLITSFGKDGKASLKQGLGDDAQDKWLVSTTPGTLIGDLIVMPTRVEEGPDAAPGTVQAFNVRTGKLAWAFKTIPHPGEDGYETWPKDAYKNTNVGAANCWAGMAVDLERKIIYVPTGSPGPDFWGGDREGQNLFANCLIALDASTGKRLWHFQFIHHDIWDRDLPAPPTLLTLRRNGKSIDAVAQVTKQGYVFVFDRVSGEPLFPVNEMPVPKSDLEGEISWPTQPIPTKPEAFARQTLTEKDVNPHAENRDALLSMIRESRTGPFQPFGKHFTLLQPGFDGGAEWGGAAADPEGILYVNSNEMAWIAHLVEPLKQDQLANLSPGERLYATYCIGCHAPDRKGNPASGFPSLIDIHLRRKREEVGAMISTGKGMMPGFGGMSATNKQVLTDFLFGEEKREGSAASATPAKAPAAAIPQVPYKLDGYVKFLDSQGYPGIRPPWGTLNAIDLNTGEYLWKITLGEFKELTAKGIPPTGTENYGGPVVTAGGLVFIAATKDGMFRAFDKKTGKLLWETELPAAGFATPTVYEVGGRQYVVVACGGTKLGTKKGESYVAFALP